MPPRKRAGNPESNGSGGPTRPLYPPFNVDTICPKCLSDRIGAAFHAANTKPGGGSDIVGGAAGYPEWLRRFCRECDYSWPEMCADAPDEYAHLIREAVRSSGLLPEFGLPEYASTSYLDATGAVLAEWPAYRSAELDGVSRWPSVAAVRVAIWVEGAEREVIVPSPWVDPPAQPAPEEPAQGGAQS